MGCNHNNINCGCKDTYLTTPPPCPTPGDCPEGQPCSEVFDAECITYTGPDLECNQDTVITQNSSIAQALEDTVGYICSLSNQIPITIVEAGDGIEVTSNTLGTTTTYTVSTELVVLKKFTYEEILPTGDPLQQIIITNASYSICGLPSTSCSGVRSSVVDLQIQGYWFNVDLNYWIDFTRDDATELYIDSLGNISTIPAFNPAPLDLGLPVTIRITIIG